MHYNYNMSHLNAHVLGNKYKNDERGCQDFSVSWSNSKGGLIVICDGAGTAERSHIGAKKIAESISDFFKHNFNSINESTYSLKPKIIDCCKDTLKLLINEYKKPEMSSEEQKKLFFSFNTTLLFLYVCYETKSYYLGHIGDGLIIGFKKDRAKILSESKTGDGGSNLTYFVSDIMTNDSHLRIQIGDTHDFIGFMCFSDGPEDFVYLKRKYLREYYERRSHAPLHPLTFQIFNHTQQNSFKKFLHDTFVEPKEDGESRSDDDCSVALLRTHLFSDENYQEQLALFDGAAKSYNIEVNKKKLFQTSLPSLRLKLYIDTAIN